MRALSALLLACCGALAACGQPQEKTYTVTDPETGEKSKISISDKAGDKSVTIRSENGRSNVSVSEAGEAPANLPDFIPLYPGADYSGSVVMQSDAAAEASGTGSRPASGAMMAFKTPDPPAKVIAFYKDAFAKAGLKEAGSGAFGPMQLLAAVKEGSDIGAQVMVSVEGGVSNVQVVYSTAQ